MKKLLLLLIFVSTSNILLSQVTSYQLGFKEVLGVSPDYQLITADGSSIITVPQQNPIDRNKIFIARIKTNGTLDWTKFYRTDDKKIIATNGIISTNDSGFIFCLKSTDSISQEIIIFKADKSGNIIWQKKILTLSIQTGEGVSGKLSQSKDGGFYYLQQNSRFYADYKGPHCALFKFDSAGKLVWKSQFSVPAESDYGTGITNITETTDMGVVLAVETVSCEAYCNKLHFLKFKPDGKPEWKYSLHDAIYSYSNAVQLLTGDENNNVVFILEGSLTYRESDYIFSVLNTNTGEAKTYTMLRDIFSLQNFLRKNSIDYIKRKSLEKFPGYNSQGYAFSNIYGFDDNWNLLNASIHQRTNQRENIFLEKYDMSGRIWPAFRLPAVDSVTTGSLSLVKSFFKLATTEEIVIEKINEINTVPANGFKVFCIGHGQASEMLANTIVGVANINAFQSGIKISPNPANAYLTVQGLQANAISTISIIDLQGRVLQMVTAKAVTHQINVSTLAKGNYILKVQDKNRTVTQKFVKH